MSSSDTPAVTDSAAEEDEEAVERDELREGLVEQAQQLLGDGFVDSHIRPGDDLWIRVKRETWQETGRIARDKLDCRFFSFISAIDWLPSPFGRYLDAEVDKVLESTDVAEAEPATIETGYAGGVERFQLIARVTNIKAGYGITFKTDLPISDLRADTWIGNYHGANWHERECCEMFGIEFVGHPFLRNLYLPTGFEGYPLRKDFPLLARLVKPWPGIVDVEDMPAQPEEEKPKEKKQEEEQKAQQEAGEQAVAEADAGEATS